jgi:hypothetical protein
VSELLDSSHLATAIHLDPVLGMVCVGVHGASGRVRAVDGFSRRVGWEAPPDVTAEPFSRAIAIGGGRAYVADGQRLTGLDLRTGVPVVRASLPAAVQTSLGRVCLADPYLPGAPGVVVVQLEDERYLAIDRFTGAHLWTLPDARDYGPLPAYGGVMAGVERDGQLALLFLDPRRGPTPVCVLPSAFALSRHYGPNVVVASPDIDGQGNAGVAVVEMPTGRLLLRELAPVDHRTGRPVIAGPYVYSADLLTLAASPRGPRPPADLLKGFGITRLEATAQTLAVLFTQLSGAGLLRLAGYDPATLAPRYYATAELGRTPALDEGRSCLACTGGLLMVAGLGTDDGATLALTTLSGDDGRVLASAREPGRLESLEAEGPFFRLRTDARTVVYRAGHAQPVGVFPFDR